MMSIAIPGAVNARAPEDAHPTDSIEPHLLRGRTEARHGWQGYH